MYSRVKYLGKPGGGGGGGGACSLRTHTLLIGS